MKTVAGLAALLLAVLVLGSGAAAQDETGGSGAVDAAMAEAPETGTAPDAAPGPEPVPEPSPAVAEALAYTLPEYECVMPRGSAFPSARARFERRMRRFNDCQSDYMGVLQSDFNRIQGAAGEATTEEQVGILSNHLTAINNRAGAVQMNIVGEEDAAAEAPGPSTQPTGSSPGMEPY